MSRRIPLLAMLTATLVVPIAPPAGAHRGDKVDRALSVLVPLEPPADSGRADAAQCSTECQADLDRARSATARYRDEQTALVDGFVPASRCESDPSGGGAMGMHYLNAARYSAPHELSVEAPEVLLYFAEATGNRRLAGIEYAVPVFQDGVPYYGIDPPDPARINPPPVLFGHPFDGPMPGHIPGQSWHYDLHVWAWSDNPRGLFAQYNPQEACLQAEP
jgi:hypothetical protein